MKHHRACPQINDPAKPCFCQPGWKERAAADPQAEPGDFSLTPPKPLEWHGKGPPTRDSSRADTARRLALVRQSKMRNANGPGPAGVMCKDCRFLIRVGGARRSYAKCRKYGVSSSEATDWREKWPSCGLFEKRGTNG